MPLIEQTEFRGRRFEATWVTNGELPPRSQISQVSAVCYTPEDQIMMISSDGLAWNIPGGQPEEGETLEEALSREVWEECCCAVTRERLLGWQHVRNLQDGSVEYQMRYACRVEVKKFEPEYEISQRKIVTPEYFLRVLEYGHSPIAKEMITLAMAANSQMKTQPELLGHDNLSKLT